MIKRTYTFPEAQKIIGFIIQNHMYYEIPDDTDVYGPTVDIYMESFNWITVDHLLSGIIEQKMKLRISVELSLVTVGNTQYYSNMPQHIIDKYPGYYNDIGTWKKVEDIGDLEIASNFLAEEYTFIRVPVPAKDGGSSITLKGRIQEHFPRFNCEFVGKVE